MRHVNGLTTVRDMLPDVSDIQFISDLDVSRDDIIVEAVRDGSGRNLLTNNLDRGESVQSCSEVPIDEITRARTQQKARLQYRTNLLDVRRNPT